MNKIKELVLLQEEVQTELEMMERLYKKSKDFNERIAIIDRITELSNLSIRLSTDIFKESHSNLKKLINY